MTLFLLYLWLKLDTFTTVSVVLAIGLTVIPGFAWLLANDSANASWKTEEAKARYRAIATTWLNVFKRTIWFSFLFLFLAVSLPSQKQGAYLIAGYAGLKLAETPEMGKLAELVRLKVGNYLDDELKSARAEAAKSIASAVSQ